MKNLIKLVLLVVLTASFTACEDPDKNPFEIDGVDGPFGSFVRFDITTSPVLDVTDIANTQFGGTISTPSNNVASYELKVRRVSGGTASDFQTLVIITSFPSEFRATAANISTALGLEISDLLPGDRFDFEGISTGLDGSITTFDDLSTDLGGNPGQAQGYRFNTFISCPFVQADAIGTYLITNDSGFGLNGITQFEVIAGSTSGKIIMVNPFGGTEAFNIVIDVTPFGIATVAEQFAFDTLEQCCAGFEDTRVRGTGFVFSCAGAITLRFDTSITQIGTGGQFTFGGITFTASKL